MKNLNDYINKYKDIILKFRELDSLLDQGDMDLFVEKNNELQREILRLPDYEIVDNYRVDIHSFKTSMDVRLKSMSSQITVKIREIIEVFVNNTDIFISMTNDVINKQPESFEEITESKILLGKVNEQLSTIKKEYNNILKLNETYKKVTSEYVKIEDFKVRLLNLIESVKNFDSRIDEQKN